MQSYSLQDERVYQFSITQTHVHTNVDALALMRPSLRENHPLIADSRTRHSSIRFACESERLSSSQQHLILSLVSELRQELRAIIIHIGLVALRSILRNHPSRLWRTIGEL